MKLSICRSVAAGLLASATLFSVSAFASEPVNLSPAAKEIVRMTEAGVDPATIQAYVETFRSKFNPQVDEIIYLHQHQVPGTVIAAMIKHEPVQDQAATAPSSQYQPAQAQAPVQQAPLAAPAHVPPPVVYTPPPVYYSYPGYYGYGGYYGGWGWPGPSIGFGFSFGDSHHGGFHGGGFHGGGFHGGGGHGGHH